jgi:1,2-diacylglycerol 3-beta-glucosyltransferase
VAVLPLSMLLFVGPLAELSVGLLIGRVERRATWRLLGFLPAFALSIWITTRAYVDGMLGRPYSWVKTTRSGATSTVRPATAPAPSALEPSAPGRTPAAERPRTFAADRAPAEVGSR